MHALLIFVVFVFALPCAAWAQSGFTLERRVAMQRALDEANWNHALWPRPEAKPALNGVLPVSVTRTKAEDALRQSNALAILWSRPVDGPQLQAEMDRIATQTKDPGALRELWAALGDDPEAIAEIQVRPLLADRLIRSWYARDERFHGALRERAQSELDLHPGTEGMQQAGGEYLELDLTRGGSGAAALTPDEWDNLAGWLRAAFQPGPAPLPIGVPSPLREDDTRFYSAAILAQDEAHLRLAVVEWRKVPFEQWWKEARSEYSPEVNAASFAYRLPSPDAAACTNDCWSYLSFAPKSRSGQVGVWTGTDLLIWGGILFEIETGGRYNPATDSWHPISNANVPASRTGHDVVWTGSEMIVWGGWGGSYSDNLFNTGARYNPLTDSWRMIGTVNAPTARQGAGAVWTGSEMVIWGGSGTAGALANGGRYSPASDSWTRVSIAGAPSARAGNSTVWTGSEMIVWGGIASTELNTGGRYNPATDTWTPTATTNAPAPRAAHTAVWSGTEMIVWAGKNGGGYTFLNSGGRYNPAANSWQATSTTNAPTPRYSHAAVWAGGQMVAFGGCLNHDCSYRTNTGGRYNPTTDGWTPTALINAPSARNTMTAVSMGSEMLVWGGCVSGECQYTTNDGARYNPAANSWVKATVPPVPFPRSEFVSVWTGAEMLVWGIDSQLLDTSIYRYAPATDTWLRTVSTGAPDARSGFSGVWTGTELIIWGGSVTGFGTMITGGRFNPGTNVWTETSTVNTPSARVNHRAVWTGTEMLVWGGCIDEACSMPIATGGRYNPAGDTWSGMAAIGAPDARYLHTALWTGAEMLVWGGRNAVLAINTGGRYSPASNSWSPMSTAGAPSGRWAHGGVWTGAEMLIWGGFNGSLAFGDGARYRPSSNTWAPVAAAGSPGARWIFPAVWTGGEMVLWGGIVNAVWPYVATNTGGRYNPAADSWTSTSMQSAPAARDLQQGVWTGSQMIVWSGRLDPQSTYTNTGGAYAATSAGGGPPPLPTVASLMLNPTSVMSGGASQGTVTLSAVAPAGGAVVALSASNGAATVPASVTVTEGALSAVFTVMANSVPAATAVTITASYNASSASALLSVTAAPPPALVSLTLSPTSVKGGSPSTGTVTLSAPAPAGGAVVALASNADIATVPAGVTIAAGAVSADFQVSTRRVPRPRDVTISATYAGTTKQATLTVTK